MVPELDTGEAEVVGGWGWNGSEGKVEREMYVGEFVRIRKIYRETNLI